MRPQSVFHAAVFPLAAFVALLSFSGQQSRAATPEQVEAAINKAKAYVYSQFHDPSWEQVPVHGADPTAVANMVYITGGQWGGTTALTTYAMLAAGESAQEPRIAKAVEFLRTADMVGTYAIALRAQVWLNVPKNDGIRDAITRDTKLLLAARRTTGANKGMYTYFNAGPTGVSDHSCSQYGVLGLWACSDAVEGIPDAFWSEADESWRQDQGADGGWAYSGKVEPAATNYRLRGYPNMTAAGVATLFICQDFLHRGKLQECTGNIVDKGIDNGLKWMGDHYKAVFAGEWPFYGLYGVERIGVASGYKYFGDVDWYQQGADWVVKQQKPDGSFPPIANAALVDKGSLANTAFALLFLSRGRAPVIMNKLDYSTPGKDEHWNERPRDVFNLAHWVGKQTEHTLNWQITNLGVGPEDWHDSPILYISGNQALNFSDENKKKLRTFVEEGGLILGNADCGDKKFADSFRKLGTELFKSYEFELEQPGSTIMHDEQFMAAKWKRKPALLSLSNGVRSLMLLIPDADPAKAWQIEDPGGKEELFQMAANIFLYAVDKNNLANKGETYIVQANPGIKPTATIDVARLSYEGNWDPEPGGWRRLSAVMHNGDSLDVTTEAVDPSKSGALAGKKIAHLTGTGPYKLGQPAIDGIKQFVKDGGTLVVDAAGGDSRFAQSMDVTLRAIFGDDADQLKQPLPPDHPLYSTGGKLEEVRYRNYARATLGSLKTPRLRGITQAGRLVCVYSPEDLSAGLVGQPVDGILGYDPATATALMRKILLLASGATPVTPTSVPPIAVKAMPTAKAAAPAKPAAPTAAPATAPQHHAPAAPKKK